MALLFAAFMTLRHFAKLQHAKHCRKLREAAANKHEIHMRISQREVHEHSLALH